MKYRFKPSWSFFLAVLLISYSCTPKPEASFQFTPATNPEAGEYIYFTNESLDAIHYYWDFGNGETSEEENPRTRFSAPGDYTVTLFAENKRHTDSVSQSLLIMPPTILEIYVYSYNYKSNSLFPLLMGTVQIWNTYDDAIRGKPPVDMLNTNREGRVTFKNLEPQRYFVYMEKDTVGGRYVAGGGVGPLEQNKINTYFGTTYLNTDKNAVLLNQSMNGDSVEIMNRIVSDIQFPENH